MKFLWRGIKALIVTVLAYLIQVCVMGHLTINGIAGSVLLAVLSILTVSCGKKYAYCCSMIIGMMMECMLANVPALYVILYPVITMLCAQIFADRDERQRIRRQIRKETKRARMQERRQGVFGKLLSARSNSNRDLPVIIRIPFCAAMMDLIMELAMVVYIYLIGVPIEFIHFLRAFAAVLYTAALSLALMVPVRWVMGMYPKWRRKRREAVS